MANKADMQYFNNLHESGRCTCNVADYLVECLTDYNSENIKEMLAKMHEYEHMGDTKKHEMSQMLAKAFVTPVDREDLALISQNIDDVTDGIEEVLQKLYMCKVKKLIPGALEFAKKIAECCYLMTDMLGEFVNFKKPAKLHQLVVELNHMEEECDALYIEAYRTLDEHCADTLEIISWRKILDSMESCADACEHVGDCVETVVMKNS